MTELIGTVLKIGKIKDYGHEENWGRKWVRVPRFFMQIQTDSGAVNCMVDCNAEETEWGLRIPKDEPRQRPFIGDKIKITTHTLKQGSNGESWASVTFNQTLEILEQNPQARAELEAFKEQKKQEREDAFKQKTEERKQKKIQAKTDRLKELENQKQDMRLPEAVRQEITQTFDLNTILMLLRDTKWFKPIEEGEGGKQAIYSLSGAIEQEGYPGSGLRRPNGALHNKPKATRNSILSKAIRTGLITETDGKYSATEQGQDLLIKLDTCESCKQQRKPYRTISHYSMPGVWSSSRDIGISYHCECEIKRIRESQRNCNSGVSFTPAFKQKKEE